MIFDLLVSIKISHVLPNLNPCKLRTARIVFYSFFIINLSFNMSMLELTWNVKCSFIASYWIRNTLESTYIFPNELLQIIKMFSKQEKLEFDIFHPNADKNLFTFSHPQNGNSTKLHVHIDCVGTGTSHLKNNFIFIPLYYSEKHVSGVFVSYGLC